jgi:hypothetical protein
MAKFQYGSPSDYLGLCAKWRFIKQVIKVLFPNINFCDKATTLGFVLNDVLLSKLLKSYFLTLIFVTSRSFVLFATEFCAINNGEGKFNQFNQDFG